MAQQLRAQPDLPEDLGPIPSTHMAAQPVSNSSFGGSSSVSGLRRYQASKKITDIPYRQSTHIHKFKIFGKNTGSIYEDSVLFT